MQSIISPCLHLSLSNFRGLRNPQKGENPEGLLSLPKNLGYQFTEHDHANYSLNILDSK